MTHEARQLVVGQTADHRKKAPLPACHDLRMGKQAAATRTTLREDLARLGVRAGDLLMVHAGLRSAGRIVGGANTVVEALLDAIGASGTLMAYVDFEPFYEESDDPDDVPVFDKRTARASLSHGALNETLRTWPGMLRSDHPDAGVAALGPLARRLTRGHPFQYGYGEGSPFERFVEEGGRVLMLGAPLDTITLLHHAEHKANIPDKKIWRYRRRMQGPDGPVWVDFEEFDTRVPVSNKLAEDCFERIGRDALAAGLGQPGKVGAADSYLFDGAALVRFGVEWIESRAR